MTDRNGTTTYGYDNQGRLVSKAAPAGTLTHTYDAAGNRLTVASSNANGTSVGYSYDELSRLKAVTDNRLPAGLNTTIYTYDAVGNLNTICLPNGVTVTPGLDTMNRVISLPVTSKPAAVYSYSYGAVGNRLTAADPKGSSTYTYDSVYRMTAESVARSPLNGTLNYGLDPVGNRLSLVSTLSGINPQTVAYDANDRLTANNFDANGNTLSANGKTFGYDSLDRMTTVNSGAVTMVYDGDGSRVAKAAGGVATSYLVDDNNPSGLAQVVEEIVGGVVQRTYTHGRTGSLRPRAA